MMVMVVSAAQANMPKRSEPTAFFEINKLPPELLLHIFELLGIDDPRSLLCAQRVCMLWFETIRSSSRLQEVLHFKPAQSKSPGLLPIGFKLPFDLRLRDYSRVYPASERVDPAETRVLNPGLEDPFRLILDQDFAYEVGFEVCSCRQGRLHNQMGPFQFDWLPLVRDRVSRKKWLRPDASWRKMMISKQMITSWTIVEFNAVCRRRQQHNYEAIKVGVEDFNNAAPDQPKYLTMGYYVDTLLNALQGDRYRYYDWFLFLGKCLVRFPKDWPNISEMDSARLYYGNLMDDDDNHAVLMFSKAVLDLPRSPSRICPMESNWIPCPIGGPIGKPLLRLNLKIIQLNRGHAIDVTPRPSRGTPVTTYRGPVQAPAPVPQT